MSSEEHEDFEEPASELAENGTNSERKMVTLSVLRHSSD